MSSSEILSSNYFLSQRFQQLSMIYAVFSIWQNTAYSSVTGIFGGNSLEISYKYFSHTSNLWNESEYFQRFLYCQQKLRVYRCFKPIHKKYGSLSRLWKPSLPSIISKNALPDCSYKLNFIGIIM
eukprot:gene2234-4343_t